MENWAIIEEAPKYLISDKGRVKNQITGKILSHSSSQGYPTVTLIVDGQALYRTIHRLVAQAFVDGNEPGLIVRHIDRDKTNYSVENLEWITLQENAEYARKGIRKRKQWVLNKETNELEEIE